MLLSKYCDCLKIKKDVYAIYNRFLFNPIFINEKEKEKILMTKKLIERRLIFYIIT